MARTPSASIRREPPGRPACPERRHRRPAQAVLGHQEVEPLGLQWQEPEPVLGGHRSRSPRPSRPAPGRPPRPPPSATSPPTGSPPAGPRPRAGRSAPASRCRGCGSPTGTGIRARTRDRFGRRSPLEPAVAPAEDDALQPPVARHEPAPGGTNGRLYSPVASVEQMDAGQVALAARGRPRPRPCCRRPGTSSGSPVTCSRPRSMSSPTQCAADHHEVGRPRRRPRSIGRRRPRPRLRGTRVAGRWRRTRRPGPNAVTEPEPLPIGKAV